METEKITSQIWEETAEPDNPFAAAQCYCYGYNVYEDVLKHATWHEYIYLLFTGEKGTQRQIEILQHLSIILANPGPRDLSVRAAMNGVGGSRNAACLIAAIAVGSGAYMGSTEIARLIKKWEEVGLDLDRWLTPAEKKEENQKSSVVPESEHPLGFDPYGESCTTPTLTSLNILRKNAPGGALEFLSKNKTALEDYFERPISMAGVVGAALYDIKLNSDQAEMLFLILRLPGAAVHAIEQRNMGWRKYPYFGDKVELTDDPALNNLGEDS